MDNQTGVLSVFFVFAHRGLDDGGRSRYVHKLLMREHDVTQQQAKGLFADYRGMNPDIRESLEATWCAKVYL